MTAAARSSTIADGIAVLRPGDLNFAHVSKLVDEFVTVTDEELSAALLVLLERHKMVVEPAGGAAVAALLTGAYVPADGPVVAILSGGNIDPMLLLRVIEHGLASAGRFLRLSVRCGDRPGELARLLSRDRRAAGQRGRRGALPAEPAAELRRGRGGPVGGDPRAGPLGGADQQLRASGYQVALLADATP